MNKFKSELKKGNFVCSECVKCNKLVWPPSDFCNRCFHDVIWRQVSVNGRLVEFSEKDSNIFCIGEFENTIRVMGTLKANVGDIKIGQEIKLAKCGFNGHEKFIFKV